MFIRLLVSAAVPLVAANLLAGLTGLDDHDGLGRVGGRFLAYFMLTTSLAICLGVAVTTVLSPGTGIALPVASGSLEAGKAPGIGDFLFNLVPDTVFAALAEDRKSSAWGKSVSVRVSLGSPRHYEKQQT